MFLVDDPITNVNTYQCISSQSFITHYCGIDISLHNTKTGFISIICIQLQKKKTRALLSQGLLFCFSIAIFFTKLQNKTTF